MSSESLRLTYSLCGINYFIRSHSGLKSPVGPIKVTPVEQKSQNQIINTYKKISLVTVTASKIGKLSRNVKHIESCWAGFKDISFQTVFFYNTVSLIMSKSDENPARAKTGFMKK